MQKKRVDEQAGITQDELLAILKQSARPNFTKRQLTQLTREGLLPQLRHTTRAGSNRPVYVWEQEVVEQAMCLYDLIEDSIPRSRLSLALWLFGFEVPFAPVLAGWIGPIETLLINLTGGAQDPEDALDHISASLVQHVEPKWKFSPRPDDVIRAVGIDAWRAFMEFFLDVLAVPAYEPDETSSEGVRETLQRINEIARTDADPEETLSWALSLRGMFSLPQLRDTLAGATVEEWAEARDDYLAICWLLHQLAALFPRRNALLTPQMRQELFLHWGARLPPLLLALRSAGYGERIDEELAGWNDLLNDLHTDAEVRKRFAKM
jgi:hypothetical protein